jgi:hypothetical protein
MKRMQKHRLIAACSMLIIVFLAGLIGAQTASASPKAQISTVAIPTVTGTPTGPMVTVRMDLDRDSINVRGGPGTFYPIIGLLLVGQQVPAKGRTSGGTWYLIYYPGVPGSSGWVSSDLVNIQPGSLPVVEPPPTPTPLVTATINPTLAAQFIITEVPTRLPTYTAPAPLVIPTFEDSASQNLPGNIPMGLVIVSILIIGVLLLVFSFVTNR